MYRDKYMFCFLDSLYSPPLCIMELHACIAECLIHQKWPGIDILKSIRSMSASYSSRSQ